LKTAWHLLVAIIFTAALAILRFVPIVLDPAFTGGATTRVCGPSGCVNLVQYDSVT
jgi:hypothetical protein